MDPLRTVSIKKHNEREDQQRTRHGHPQAEQHGGPVPRCYMDDHPRSYWLKTTVPFLVVLLGSPLRLHRPAGQLCGECSKTASGRCCWGRLIAASLSRSRSLSLFPLQQWSPGCFTWSGSTPRDRRQKLLELLDLKFLRFNFWNILLVEASHKAKPVLMSGDTEPTS